MDSDVDLPSPNSIRKPNWVIDAFNRDLPYDQFVVEQIAGDLGVKVQDLIGNEQLLKAVKPTQYAQYGELTVKDILKELMKPGLDPRQQASGFEFANI